MNKDESVTEDPRYNDTVIKDVAVKSNSLL